MSDFVEPADGPSARSPAIEEDLSFSSHQRSMSDFVEQADGPSALPVKSFDSFFDAFSARPHDRLRSKKTCPSRAISVLCPTSSNKRTGRPHDRLRSKKTCPSRAISVLCPTSSNKRTGRPHDRLRSKRTYPSQAISVLCPTSSNKRTGRPRSRLRASILSSTLFRLVRTIACDRRRPVHLKPSSFYVRLRRTSGRAVRAPGKELRFFFGGPARDAKFVMID